MLTVHGPDLNREACDASCWPAGLRLTASNDSEISVFLNGNQIGYLSRGPNDALNGGDTFPLPASLQDSGENRIVFRQRSPGWIWGVTQLLLSDTGN